MSSRSKLHLSKATLVVCAAVLLVISGCGDDGDSGAAPPTATRTTVPVPATSTRTSTIPVTTATPTASQEVPPTATVTPTTPSGGMGSETEFLASLDGEQEVPPVVGVGAGTASFTLNAEGTEIAFVVGIEGIDVSEITQSHLHVAPRGFNGPVVIPLTGAPSSLPLEGTVTEDDLIPNEQVSVLDFDDFIEAMEAGDVYVNVHTMANPAGEIRGQLRGPRTFFAALDGEQEVPPVIGVPGGTAAVPAGTAAFILSADETRIDFEVEIEGLEASQITASHLHVAPPGMNGPVVVPLTGPPSSLPLMGTVTEDDLIPDSEAGIESFADLIDAIEEGDIYVNVHSMENMDGEIRGQLQTPVLFSAMLSGDQEVGPVETDASGLGQVVLSADGTSLRFALSVFDLPEDQITQAHIHVAPAGVNGPVVLFLSPGSFSSPLIGTLTADDLIPNPDAGINDFDDFLEALFAGETYMNVHSMTNMGGEVRGQLE